MKELRKIPVKKELITNPKGEIVINRRGLAPEYNLIESDGKSVFRHYTSKEVAKLIKESGGLKAGPRPSAITLHSSLEFNTDIYGVFFTRPEFVDRVAPELLPLDFIPRQGRASFRPIKMNL